MSTIPMMAITQGNPMVSAMDPPIDGPKGASGGQVTSATARHAKVGLAHLDDANGGLALVIVSVLIFRNV